MLSQKDAEDANKQAKAMAQQDEEAFRKVRFAALQEAAKAASEYKARLRAKDPDVDALKAKAKAANDRFESIAMFRAIAAKRKATPDKARPDKATTDEATTDEATTDEATPEALQNKQDTAPCKRATLMKRMEMRDAVMRDAVINARQAKANLEAAKLEERNAKAESDAAEAKVLDWEHKVRGAQSAALYAAEVALAAAQKVEKVTKDVQAAKAAYQDAKTLGTAIWFDFGSLQC